MAFSFHSTDSPEYQERAVAFYQTLSEKDRRRFLSLEAQRLGHGGIAHVASVFNCSRRTIERGLAELAQLPDDPAKGRIRRPGGGRKKRSTPTPNSKRT